MQLLVIQFKIKIFHIGMYIPGQHGNSINIQVVYTATTQTDFMRSKKSKIILAHFIVNRTILIF